MKNNGFASLVECKSRQWNLAKCSKPLITATIKWNLPVTHLMWCNVRIYSAVANIRDIGSYSSFYDELNTLQSSWNDYFMCAAKCDRFCDDPVRHFRNYSLADRQTLGRKLPSNTFRLHLLKPQIPWLLEMSDFESLFEKSSRNSYFNSCGAFKKTKHNELFVWETTWRPESIPHSPPCHWNPIADKNCPF